MGPIRLTSRLRCLRHTQVHDELLFEVQRDQLAAAAKLVREVMEGVQAKWQLRVPLPVQLRVGPSWGHLAPYEERGREQLRG